ncbi:metalloregulator ArsR/SmtB family transcription factor [Marinomonas pollencensis]|uniref:ArsR family transcriptional regulator n=1 Tax=Marinomonas pollencensis TaxID=491954 RepID=A0A3E0DMB1_9GAMM|nr:metalloregulator ArsR/SmtB family transcription factor [Marinomonas pollencensis]REG82910.1 ArsR family transcriptional regulator [Marinomonas pollencensis]
MTKLLLFLCTGNSARSQLAEAIFNHLSKGNIRAISAGVSPTEIDERVYDALQEQGVNGEGLYAKSYQSIANQKFDYVVTLCDAAKDECVFFEEDIAQLHWDFVDPKPLQGIEPFHKAVAGLIERITLFLMLNNGLDEQSVDPSLLFKLMSDPTRLKMLMLLEDESMLTVSDLVIALAESQPKVSRHLAVLRDSSFLKATKNGLWVRYQVSNDLPIWIRHLLQTVRTGNPSIINAEKARLKAAISSDGEDD